MVVPCSYSSYSLILSYIVSLLFIFRSKIGTLKKKFLQKKEKEKSNSWKKVSEVIDYSKGGHTFKGLKSGQNRDRVEFPIPIWNLEINSG